MLDAWENKGKGLAAACDGAANDVAAGEDAGNGLALNGGRTAKLVALEKCHDIGGKTTLSPLFNGRGNIETMDSNIADFET